MTRIVRFLVCAFALALLSAWMATPSYAVDPQCQGVTQGAVNVQDDGLISVCFPAQDTNNQPLDPSVKIDVKVAAKNPVDGVLVSATASGLPGTYAQNVIDLVESDGTTHIQSQVDPATLQPIPVTVTTFWKRSTETVYAATSSSTVSVTFPSAWGTGAVAPGFLLP